MCFALGRVGAAAHSQAEVVQRGESRCRTGGVGSKARQIVTKMVIALTKFASTGLFQDSRQHARET